VAPFPGSSESTPHWEFQSEKLLHSQGQPSQSRHPQGCAQGQEEGGPECQPEPAKSVEIFMLDSWQPPDGLRQQAQGAHSPACTAARLPPAAGGAPGALLAVYPGLHSPLQAGAGGKGELRGIPERGLPALGAEVTSPKEPKEHRPPGLRRDPSHRNACLSRPTATAAQRRHGPAMGVSPHRELAKAHSERERKPKSILVVDRHEYLARTSPLDRRVTFREYVDLFVFVIGDSPMVSMEESW